MDEPKKTYKLLSHTEAISKEEIKSLYDGYWVYIVKAKFTEARGLIEGIPVVIGSVPYDGVDDGIYEKYKTDEYVERVGISLRHGPGFISSLRLAESAYV
ncbi:MAG: hypothetical protein FWB96_13290 [Defluviitaleaceae bacterium]|nr:hypothetical protein [Defluviitaleaceae bacterium]MCL2264235.1 hypothetical protein [Defluviitaleaceae bacterium]